MAEGIGSLACRVCGAAYKMHISYLSEPIDVFYEWLDDCEKAAQEDDGRAEVSEGHRAACGAACRAEGSIDCTEDSIDSTEGCIHSALSRNQPTTCRLPSRPNPLLVASLLARPSYPPTTTRYRLGTTTASLSRTEVIATRRKRGSYWLRDTPRRN